MAGKEQETLKAGKNLTTVIKTNIENNEVDSAEDNSAKKIFSYRKILAVLLKLCVREYAECTLEEIYGYIEAIKEKSVEVSLGMGGETVRQEKTETQPGSEKRTYFDIYFDALIPKSDKKRRFVLKIDLEIQKTLALEYPVEYRGIYYLAREMSAQLDYVYEDTTEYKDLSKVMTIWVCINEIPKHLQNTVIRHKMMIDEVVGVEKEKAPEADLMEMIIIRLGGNMNEKSHEVIKYLYGIFENVEYGEYFNKYISVEDIEKEPGIRKELENMSGVALLNYRDGETKGIQKGKILSLYFDAEWSEEQIAEKYNLKIEFVRDVIENEKQALTQTN